jgi:hypothetical protein
MLLYVFLFYFFKVNQELPYSIGNFRRWKRINEFVSVFGGLGYFAVVVVATAILYRGAMLRSVNRVKRYIILESLLN